MLNSGSEGASLQALKLEAASIPTNAQGFKLQAKILKLQNLRARVQAAGPKLQGASNKDKCIFCMLHMKANLVG
jgi:hypothetical protein